MEITKDNINEVIESLNKEDRDYIILNNIRIINPLTGGIGKRFKHYMAQIRDCQHEHTVLNSYPRRSGEKYFTVCCNCGKSWLD